MAAEAARDYSEKYIYGSAVPAGAGYAEPVPESIETPVEREQAAPRTKTASGAKSKVKVSPVAILGALAVAILAVFVMLAQINYNEVARETVRLNEQLRQLTEQERMLEITFESVVDLKFVELYAKDVLGMSKPETGQVTVVRTVVQDRAEVIEAGGEKSALRDFAAFVSTLTEYFRRSR